MPEPLPTSLGPLPEELLDDLAVRYQRIPRQRIRRWADYWALRDVEEDHVGVLARRFDLSDDRRRDLGAWWWRRVDGLLADQRLRWSADQRRDVLGWALTARTDGRLSTAWFQLRFNTLGPGGRCWIGNRYTTVRHYTFRLHWRP